MSRAVALAAAAGIAFGASSALVRAIGAHTVAAGPVALLGWPTLALAVVAPVGFVLCQHAYRDGSLGAALSTMTVVDPMTAIAFAAGLLGEDPAHRPARRHHRDRRGSAHCRRDLCPRPAVRPAHPTPIPAAVAPRATSIHVGRITDRPLTRIG